MERQVKISVVGAAGRMGKTILGCIEEEPGACIHGGAERPGGPSVGTDIGETAGLGAKGIPIAGALADCMKGADAVIDFSSPETSMETLRLASEMGVAAVIGTTGFSPEQKKEIERLSKNIRCVLAPNMSIGVNVMFKMASLMAQALGDAYDVEIVEAHHKFKKGCA